MDYREKALPAFDSYASDRKGGINVGKQATVNTSTTSESPTLIRDVVTTLEEQVKYLHEAVSRLQNRLDTALQAVPPTPCDPTTAGLPLKSGSSHLHCRLITLSDDLSDMITRVSDLTRRVEI